MSREIPPCMAMGEAAGEAAALALEGSVALDGSMWPSCRSGCARGVPILATGRRPMPAC